jgi:hypothetical protein
MRILKADFDKWHIQYVPDDGGRIAGLSYAGHDLLTSAPEDFKPPVRNFGEFETRPVYGYDDCFPTVDPCIYPGGKSECRDHGELWRKNWHAETREDGIIFTTNCRQPEVIFKRILIFAGNKLTWRFEVEGMSGESAVFLHVMHPLMPLNRISKIEVPACLQVIDELRSEDMGLQGAADVIKYLWAVSSGSFEMLLLRDIDDGFVRLGLTKSSSLEIRFDHKLFPTLGIWWNKGGYPDGGQLRTECAFEPIPGSCSDLSKSVRDGNYLSVEPGKKLCWEIQWIIS